MVESGTRIGEPVERPRNPLGYTSAWPRSNEVRGRGLDLLAVLLLNTIVEEVRLASTARPPRSMCANN